MKHISFLESWLRENEAITLTREKMCEKLESSVYRARIKF